MSIVPEKLSDPCLSSFEPSRASQAAFESTKISSILEKFRVNGVLPNVNIPPLDTSEFGEINDFSELQNVLTDANNGDYNEYTNNDNFEGDNQGSSLDNSQQGENPPEANIPNGTQGNGGTEGNE